MGCIRPATPGFLVTLTATALLAVVSFCVPYFKSVYFLKASVDLPNNQTGSITFGTLGYCIEFPSNGTTCSKPSIGYQLDINALVGNNLPVEIPQVAVKWITYALFLHVVALILSAGSAAFGLLAHIREMSMTCCSTCVSGFAASVALIAFIFDLVLFFVARARINAVGSASIGNAIWLTLAAWVLLFFSGCFYCLGRCCVSRRPRNGGEGWGEGKGKDPRYEPPPKNEYAEQVRLDAVKAEADRKARAKQQEVGLPAFSETQPLTARIDGDHVYLDDDTESKAGTSSAHGSLAGRKPSQNTLNSNRPAYAAGGYVQGAAGHRAVDEYYNPTSPPMPNSAPNTYPPQPHRQGSSHTYNPAPYDSNQPYGAPQRQGSGYQPSAGGPPGLGGYGGYQTTSPPPQQMLNVPGQYNDPYSPQAYGHTHGGSSYHTASAHSQHPSAYSPYEQGYDQPQTGVAYSTPPPQQQQTEYYSPQPNSYYTNEPPSFLAPGLVAQSTSPPPIGGGYGQQQPSPYEQPYTGAGGNGYDQQQRQPTRQYTLGGDGYGQSSVPPLQEDIAGAAYDPYGAQVGVGAAGSTSPVRGPRAQPLPASSNPYIGGAPEESPPGYEQGDGQVQGRWGKQ